MFTQTCLQATLQYLRESVPTWQVSILGRWYMYSILRKLPLITAGMGYSYSVFTFEYTYLSTMYLHSHSHSWKKFYKYSHSYSNTIEMYSHSWILFMNTFWSNTVLFYCAYTCTVVLIKAVIKWWWCPLIVIEAKYK